MSVLWGDMCIYSTKGKIYIICWKDSSLQKSEKQGAPAVQNWNLWKYIKQSPMPACAFLYAQNTQNWGTKRLLLYLFEQSVRPSLCVLFMTAEMDHFLGSNFSDSAKKCRTFFFKTLSFLCIYYSYSCLGGWQLWLYYRGFIIYQNLPLEFRYAQKECVLLCASVTSFSFQQNCTPPLSGRGCVGQVWLHSDCQWDNHRSYIAHPIKEALFTFHKEYISSKVHTTRTYL